MSANSNDFDNVLYAGLIDLGEEVQSDVEMHIVQPVRSMYYNRSIGSTIQGMGNAPISLSQNIKLGYEVARSLALRNSRVTNGREGFPDRRVLTSQKAVIIYSTGIGELNIDVNYIPLYNYKQQINLSLPLG